MTQGERFSTLLLGRSSRRKIGGAPVFSSDGRASMPFPIGTAFPNDNRMSDAEIERQVKQFGRGDEAGWTLGTATGRGFRKQ